jgi:hypothetical protein
MAVYVDDMRMPARVGRISAKWSHLFVGPFDDLAELHAFVTPSGGLVLDLFAGSGATAEACIVEGFPCLLIEQDPKSAELIRKRLQKPIQPDIFGGAA